MREEVDIADFRSDVNRPFSNGKFVYKGLDYNSKEVDPYDNKCVAKIISDNFQVNRYYLRSSGEGFFNPTENNVEDLKIFDNVLGKRKYEFRKVSKEIYDSYVLFLKNHNVNLLKQIEREYNNA